MNTRNCLKYLLAMLGLLPTLNAKCLSQLNGVCRHGQVFLQWQEKNLPAHARLSVWGSDHPITPENIGSATCLARYLNPGSARDWWLDRSSFIVEKGNTRKSEEIFAGQVAQSTRGQKLHQGFILETGGKPIDPDSGLHVHTPDADQCGKRYFAVAWHRKFEDKIQQLTATTQPIEVKEAPIQPIVVQNRPLLPQSAAGMPLIIYLHGRGGGVGVDAKGRPQGTHLWFSSKKTAWREGIPFKFTAYISGGTLTIVLYDRVWIGRPLTRQESRDARDYVPAISTFWLGYNPNIAVGNRGPHFKIDNYTERYILEVIHWAQTYLGSDPHRTYLSGGSMGGTGAVQMALHYPEVFAAVRAYVPIYSYSWRSSGRGGRSITRLQCSTGQFTPQNSAYLPDGRDILEYGDGCRFVQREAVDIPPIFATNGRRDLSMPWINNPPFFQAANKGRQALVVYWNDGDHGMSSAEPRDMKDTAKKMMQCYRLNASYPAFSNRSDNGNYGQGDPDDGDAQGWINRGISWSQVVDQPQRYEIALQVAYPNLKYPVTGDVTLRRRQLFRPTPGTRLQVTCAGETQEITLPASGVLTIRGVKFTSGRPVKLTIRSAR